MKDARLGFIGLEAPPRTGFQPRSAIPQNESDIPASIAALRIE